LAEVYINGDNYTSYAMSRTARLNTENSVLNNESIYTWYTKTRAFWTFKKYM